MKVFKLLVVLITLIISSCDDKNEIGTGDELTVSYALSGSSDSGYLKAYDVRQFRFPEDNGPHYGYRTEWWYFTGNLSTDDNRQFGYQFTIFRTAINPDTAAYDSTWRTNQIYMGHFTITDVNENKFYYFERFSRAGNELAGAESSPFRVWLENWSIKEVSQSQFDFPDVNLKASHDNISLDIKLEPLKNIVLQGNEGLSRKGSDSGNASYYYSVSRIKTEGTITINNESFYVTGSSWLDREWSTSALSREQQGWDWFSLKLDNNHEIMYYQMRKNDGTPDKYSSGVIIYPDGNMKNITLENVEFTVTEDWKNDRNNVYPSGWLLKIPEENIELNISPLVKDQELIVTVRYWEGAVNITGLFAGNAITGKGYVELTGYADDESVRLSSN